jgi:hypothetical protein
MTITYVEGELKVRLATLPDGSAQDFVNYLINRLPTSKRSANELNEPIRASDPRLRKFDHNAVATIHEGRDEKWDVLEEDRKCQGR